MTTAEALLPLWVEQADIAYRLTGPDRAETILRHGMQNVAIDAALRTSDVSPLVAATVRTFAETGEYERAWKTLRDCELILVAAGHDRVRAA